MTTHHATRRSFPVSARALLAAALLCAVAPAGSAGTWTRLLHNAPSKANLMLLLSDGTVMVAKNNGSTIGKGWERLTPDATGSYINGTWTTLASAIDTRLYYASEVLRDGRVMCAGGEYGTGGPHAEIYDPQANTWTKVDPPSNLWNTATDTFYDANSETLPDGRVLFMPVGPHSFGVGLIYDPVANTWINAGALKHGGSEDESAWVKLPDGSIMTIDAFSTHSERFYAATNTWINDTVVPTAIYDSVVGEMGGAVLLPTGQAMFLGSTGHTAIYQPSGSPTFKGTWTIGPDFPNGQGTPDAPASMLVTGNVLCATSATPTGGNNFPSPTSFYEYDPFANGFTQVNAPVGMTDGTATFPTAMLALPDGGVLYSHMGTDLYEYRPSGTPLAAGKPTVSAITQNGDGTWHLDGTGLNGLNEGAVYGDDLQMYSNYPLVRLTSGGIVRYARTFNWSSTGVMTGATPVSTEFSTAGFAPGDYSLEVVAGGIASDPVPFTQPPVSGWLVLGSGLAGQVGVPTLVGTGSLIGGQPAELDLSLARPLAPAALFVGLTNNPTPFKGGLLVPVPFLLTIPLSVDVSTTINFPFTWPTGLPTGTSIFFQYGIQDSAAVQGVALSNAVSATTP